mgnify:CR=1 FL=1
MVTTVQKHEEAMARSRRALWDGGREAWAEWLSGLAEWNLFGGLTVDPKRREVCRMLVRDGNGRLGWKGYRRVENGPVAPGRDGLLDAFREWVRAGRRALGRDIEYVVALEYHRSGWPHLHPLLALEGGLMAGDVTTLGGLWYVSQGYAKLEVPRTMEGVARYCARYLVKDLDRGDLLFSEGLRCAS